MNWIKQLIIQTFRHTQDVENELVAQVSMKQEMELAMKLLEKDIHEKQVIFFAYVKLIGNTYKKGGENVLTRLFLNEQDTLIGLRHQLDEVKAINVEMYQKMQVERRTTLLHFSKR